MYFLLSGEGATDLGRSPGNAEIAEGDDYEHGPMAILIDRIVERLNGLVEGGTIDFERITMPSFAAFRRRFESLIAPHAVEPSETSPPPS